jgi:hypothetical protein
MKHRFAISTLGFSVLLCAVYSLLLRALHPSPNFGEESLIVNRMRLERFHSRAVAPAAIVGTSLSGRLRPEFFEGTALADYANLALDGTPPIVGVEFLKKRTPLPRLILIEANGLQNPVGDNIKTLREIPTGPAWSLAMRSNIFRAEARPSTLFYSWLKQRSDVKKVGQPSPIVASAIADSIPMPELLEEWTALIESLQTGGASVALVFLPCGRAIDSRFAEELGKNTGAKILRIDERFRQKAVEPRYTDGLHMDGGTSRLAAKFLSDSVAAAK